MERLVIVRGESRLVDIDFADFEVVYFIQANETHLVKIGWTSDISRRFRQFQTASPHDLGLLAIHPGGKDLEARYHAELAPYRQRGEWFHLTEQVRLWLMMYLRDRFVFEWKSLIRHDREICKGNLVTSLGAKRPMDTNYMKGLPDEIGYGYGI